MSIVQAEEIMITDSVTGKKFNAYASGPKTANAAVLIVHDWFGVTDFTRESVDRLGHKGIRTIAIDLYNGKSAKDHDGAKKLMNALNPDETQIAIKASLKRLGENQKNVALVGYSLGGKLALGVAAENPELMNATALIYGGSFEYVQDKTLKSVGPLLAITGSKDEWSYTSNMMLEKRLHGLGKSMESYVYPGADHAFPQPLYNKGKTYDAVATSAMRNVLDHFLNRHLGITIQ